MPRPTCHKGFTLIELLIAMAMTGIIMAVIVTSYQIQVRGKNTQEITIDMQQTARAAFEILESDIQLAGCDPTGDVNAGFEIAKPAELRFTMDIGGGSFGGDADGDMDDLNENIRYALTNDADGDGISDGTPCDLGRVDFNDPNNAAQTLLSFAENIDAVNFVYLAPDGTNSTPDGNMDILASDPTTATGVAPANLEDIRAIQVTIVARSGETVRGMTGRHTDSTNYYNLQNDLILPAQNDQFRRFLLTKTIYCRNNR